MTNATVRTPPDPTSLENPADRRRAPRLKAEDVPWIVTVKLGQSDAARLVDISRTGLLLETKERLRPGQRGITTLGLTGNRSEQVPSHILRSHLIALTGEGVPVYHAALLFAKELESNLLVPVGINHFDVGPSAQRSYQLDGPFDALWATERGSELARVTSLSETGCIVHLPVPSDGEAMAAVTVIFTPVRRLLLTGRVTGARSDGGRVMQFEGLHAEQSRALRIELTSHVTGHTTAATSSSGSSIFSIADVPPEVVVYIADLQASHW